MQHRGPGPGFRVLKNHAAQCGGLREDSIQELFVVGAAHDILPGIAAGRLFLDHG